jgi:hypothetical protein
VIVISESSKGSNQLIAVTGHYSPITIHVESVL